MSAAQSECDMMPGMFRTIVFFSLVTSAFAGESLGPLVNASVGFSMAIQQQLATTRSDPSPIALAAKTIVYADAKTAYFSALRDAAPELMNIATGREARPPELDKFAATFAVAGANRRWWLTKRRRFG
jgi:hypothetical protein